MAKTFGEFQITHEKRLCTVDGRHGYFHCWEQYADVIAPGLTVGSHPGGQYSRVYGIVEFADGIERVGPHRIKFVDEENSCLGMFDREADKQNG